MGFVGSLLAGLGTSLGALPALIFGRPGERVETIMLGFAAGVMLAASIFSLIIPGLDAATIISDSENIRALIVVCGILTGGAAIWIIHQLAPHEHFISGPEGAERRNISRIWRSGSASGAVMLPTDAHWRWVLASKISRKAWPWPPRCYHSAIHVCAHSALRR
jgi:zinc transporter ZupT